MACESQSASGPTKDESLELLDKRIDHGDCISWPSTPWRVVGNHHEVSFLHSLRPTPGLRSVVCLSKVCRCQAFRGSGRSTQRRYRSRCCAYEDRTSKSWGAHRVVERGKRIRAVGRNESIEVKLEVVCLVTYYIRHYIH
jgi:hypothetical protein